MSLSLFYSTFALLSRSRRTAMPRECHICRQWTYRGNNQCDNANCPRNRWGMSRREIAAVEEYLDYHYRGLDVPPRVASRCHRTMMRALERLILQEARGEQRGAQVRRREEEPEQEPPTE